MKADDFDNADHFPPGPKSPMMNRSQPILSVHTLDGVLNDLFLFPSDRSVNSAPPAVVFAKGALCATHTISIRRHRTRRWSNAVVVIRFPWTSHLVEPPKWQNVFPLTSKGFITSILRWFPSDLEIVACTNASGPAIEYSVICCCRHPDVGDAFMQPVLVSMLMGQPNHRIWAKGDIAALFAP